MATHSDSGGEMTAPIAARIALELDEHFPLSVVQRHLRNGLAIAEEAGEAVGALCRYLELSRRTGTLEEIADELADLAISTYIAAHYLGIDLSEAVENKADIIISRGLKEPR
jgi:NTP pyrophosphatase (non-canonical NTP hydrolase)